MTHARVKVGALLLAVTLAAIAIAAQETPATKPATAPTATSQAWSSSPATRPMVMPLSIERMNYLRAHKDDMRIMVSCFGQEDNDWDQCLLVMTRKTKEKLPRGYIGNDKPEEVIEMMRCLGWIETAVPTEKDKLLTIHERPCFTVEISAGDLNLQKDVKFDERGLSEMIWLERGIGGLYRLDDILDTAVKKAGGRLPRVYSPMSDSRGVVETEAIARERGAIDLHWGRQTLLARRDIWLCFLPSFLERFLPGNMP